MSNRNNQEILEELRFRGTEALKFGICPGADSSMSHKRFEDEINGFTSIVILKQFWTMLRFLTKSHLSDKGINRIAVKVAKNFGVPHMVPSDSRITSAEIQSVSQGEEELHTIGGWINKNLFESAFLENPQDGGGIDLVVLEIYAYLGYLHSFECGWNPEILTDLIKNNLKGEMNINDVRNNKFNPLVDPHEYIQTLIRRCEHFINCASPGNSQFQELHQYFNNTVKYARARLALDTQEYISIEDLSFITGLSLLTLVNKKNILHESENGIVIKKIDAIDLITLESGRDRKMAHPLLEKRFYKSIWEDQIRLGCAPCLEFYEDDSWNIEITKMLIFKKPFLQKKLSHKIISKNKFEDSIFVQFCKKFHPNVAPHNKARVEWIGLGKTFNEINAPNSKYRECVVRQTYAGNSSEIIEDLKYDLKKGWIKEV